MSRLLVLPVAVPLGAAALAVVLRARPRVQRLLAAATAATVLGCAVALLAATADGGTVAVQVGGWVAGIAIPFAADTFGALMLTVAALMVAVCTAFAVAARADARPLFHPLVLVLSGGAYGAFLTADLFNLFVMIEVMLVPSYALLPLLGGKAQIRAGAVYVAVSLLASTLLLSGVGLVYATAGTVNLGGLAGAARASTQVALAAGVVALALAVKVAVVPLHGWLPRTYPAAPPAVTALFSGLLTKVGVYALYRLYAVVFDGDPRYRGVLLALAGLTMVVGVLGAVGQNGMRDILSFHMVSQNGYLLLGLALFGPLGLAAGIFYTVQYIVVKGSLFLSAGAVEALRGTERLDRLGGMARGRPLLAVAFLLAALSLAGIPPLSGFVAKVLLIRAAFTDGQYASGAIAVAVSFFTLFSMVKIGNGVFWGRSPQPDPVVAEPRPAPVPVVAGGAADTPVPGLAVPGLAVPAGGQVPADGPVVRRPRRPSRAFWLVVPALLTAALSLAAGLGAQGLLAVSERAAAGLLDPARYAQAVLGR